VAVVTQAISPARTYSPFEGMSEQQRLYNAVPRGLVRFAATNALTAKPVNDSIDFQATCSLPDGFAYIVSSLSFDIRVDTATDWDANCTVIGFNTLPNSIPGNNQIAVFAMSNIPQDVAEDPRRTLNYSLGDIRTWFPQPLVKPPGATGMSMLLQYHNSAAAVQAAGQITFNLAAYQYELNQAVRFPLNSPFPVGIR